MKIKERAKIINLFDNIFNLLYISNLSTELHSGSVSLVQAYLPFWALPDVQRSVRGCLSGNLLANSFPYSS